jgi:hypothetical protein
MNKVNKVWSEFRAGWQAGRWIKSFSVYLLFTTSIAVLLAFFIDGKFTSPPSRTLIILAVSAALVSIYFAKVRVFIDGRGRGAFQDKTKRNNTRISKGQTRINKRTWMLILISIASILLVIQSYKFITKSVPVSFTSKLTQVGNIELSYGERQSEKVSPLCGCYDIGEWERWRGITFTSRNIEIERKGELPATGYLLFSPSPHSTTIHPDFFKMNVAYYLIEILEDEVFNPRVLLSDKLPENYNLLKRENSDEGFVQILSRSGLRVSLLGDKPLGAWIPMENSKVSITHQLRQDISEPTATVIKEQYLASTHEELEQVWLPDGAYDQTKMAMPLGDFLGPKVVFWNEDEPTSVLASSKVLHVPEEIAGKKLIKAIVVNPPFAVRVVAIPFSEDAIFKTRDEAPERGEGDYSPITSQGRFDNGEANIKIYTADNQAEEFEKLYQSIKQQGTTVSDFKTYYSREIEGGKMVFRYPPIPPNNGFNIFGKMNKLKVDSTLGNLLVGTRSFNIEAPATLELKDIKALEIKKNGIMEIPIQIEFGDTPSRIQLNATSEVYVNDESITRRIDNNKTLIDYIVLLGTVIGIITAIVSGVVAIKDVAKSYKA